MSSVLAVTDKDWLRDAYKESFEIDSDPFAVELEAKDLYEASTSVSISMDRVSVGQDNSVFVKVRLAGIKYSVIGVF